MRNNKPLTWVAIICMIALTLSTIVWMWNVKQDTMEAIERGVQKASENKMQEQIDKLEEALSSFSEARASGKLTKGLEFWQKLQEAEDEED